jgi:RimJ/RimL family protein N-acetyltransferase
MPFPDIRTEQQFKDFYDKFIGGSADECLFAISDKTGVRGKQLADGGAYAGVILLTSTNAENASTEIGVIVFPEYQRTHVATNAIGLLLQWTLDPPPAGGLGLRRVEWRAHVDNRVSRATAERFGFELEGIARWQRVLPNSKTGLPVDALEKRNGTSGEHPGRHTAIYSLVWDEWDDKRPAVVALMERRA